MRAPAGPARVSAGTAPRSDRGGRDSRAPDRGRRCHSSPARPTGPARAARPARRACVRDRRPDVIGSQPCRAERSVDQIVVSVGPYMFHSSPPPARAVGERAGSASPPQSAVRPGRPGQPASSNRRQVAGVACIRVIAVRSARRAGARGSTPSRARRCTTARPRRAAATARGRRCRRTASSPPAARRLAEPGRCAHRRDEVGERAVRISTPFGSPGRAGGVNHVGELFRVALARRQVR